MDDINPLTLREIVLNVRKPTVLKNFPINWSCFQHGIEEWSKIFDESNSSPTKFERMEKSSCEEPQWERKRKEIEMTAMQFLKEHSKDCNYWSGLNYKRRHELPDKSTSGIDFSQFGFPQVSDDSTLWLSSSGANTPCHYDAYGCNIVVQVYGKKSWHLFSPNTPLTTTRIPYEESSIYCKENFFSPSDDMMKCLQICKELVYHVILEPNDVLIVPKHWWHYVEAVNTSLSVNAWIPLECDLDDQLEECILKYLMENFVKNSSLANRTYMMNPNQLTSMATNDEIFEILQYLVDETMKPIESEKKKKPVHDYHYLSEIEVEQLLKEYKSVVTVLPMSTEELECFLKPRIVRSSESKCEDSPLGLLEEALINSICSPYIIKSIKTEFFQRYKERKNNLNTI